MSSTAPAAQTYTRRAVVAPLRSFLQTESGSAGVLVLAIVAALVWANVAPGSYGSVWGAPLSIRLGEYSVTRDLGEQRPDDVLLPRRRAGGAARDRPRRPA